MKQQANIYLKPNGGGESIAAPPRTGNEFSRQSILREIARAAPISPESISYANKRKAVSARMNSIASHTEPINWGACAVAPPAVANPGPNKLQAVGQAPMGNPNVESAPSCLPEKKPRSTCATHSIASGLNEEKALTHLLNDELFNYMEDRLHAVQFLGAYLNSSRYETGAKFQFIFEIAGRARRAPVFLEVLSFSYDLAKNLSIEVSAAAVMGESPSNLTDTMDLRYHKIIKEIASKLLPAAVSSAAGEFAYGELHSARNKFGLSREVEIEVACLLWGKPLHSFVAANHIDGSRNLSLEIDPASNAATLKTLGKTQQFEFMHLGRALDCATDGLRSLQASKSPA